MTVLFSIYCGTDTNGHDVNAEAIVKDLASRFFPDGHSIREESGRYLMRSTGETVDEKTLVVTWFGDADSSDKVYKFAIAVKNQTFQESVLVSKQHANIDFV